MQQVSPYTRRAGSEPIPGYRLLEPLGRGGFGEVWKCEAPGGLVKAIKFVRSGGGGSCPATQERNALDRMKRLRHPFLLSLERVEEVDDTLVIIMELADQSLYNLQNGYRDAGRPGVPRDELLGYLLEAAEALDWMNFEHGLQHLDVKPHNLFLVSGHVKLADFGLVQHLGEGEGPVHRRGGVTPLYSAPEFLRGTLSRRCDQYSLAVVYQQLLTGTVPFWHENVYELLMQHLCAEPDLGALAEEDRPAVWRALAKSPEQRFNSCLDFVQMLLGNQKPTLRRSGQWRRVLTGDQETATGTAVTPSRLQDTQAEKAGHSGGHEGIPEPTQLMPPPVPFAGRGEDGRPPSETPTRRIRTLSAAQRAAGEVAWQGLGDGWNPAGTPRAEGGGGPEPSGRAGSAPEPAAAFSDEDPTRALRPVRPPSLPPAILPQIFPAASCMPAPTAVSIPGYRFLSCLSQGPLGDLWRAEDGQGNPCRALCLLGFLRYDARLIAHLQALRDPALPATEVHWSSAERLVVLTNAYEGALRDRMEQRVAEGNPGIPRAELLPLMRSAAESLDALSARYGMQHLGLHPRNLLVDGERLQISEFGLIPLVWLPAGQPASALNGRYAAPELFDRKPSRSADQYSLALVYAEMLTGVHPRPQRPGSGLHRRVSPGAPRGTGAHRPVKLDLDMLPAHDREVVARALANDPELRFPTCTAFVEALELAGAEPPAEDPCQNLPAVIPYAALLGEPAGPETVLPPLGQIVNELTRASVPRTVAGPHNSRYYIQPNGSWEYRCPVQLFPGAMGLKVEGLRVHWNARVVHKEEASCRLQMDLPAVQGSFWTRYLKQPKRVEIDIRVDGEVGQRTRLTEARVRVSYLDPNREQGDRILATMAPQIFDSVRLYFQTPHEQRHRERWVLGVPLRVYPILSGLELGETLDGTCKNVSCSGISFVVPKDPEAEHLYLHLYQSPQALGYALLAQVVRRAERPGGWEVGATFVDPLVANGLTPA